MMKDYWILVMPTPWRWLSLTLSVVFLAINAAMYALIMQNQRRTRRRVAHIAEPLIDICRRHGFTEEAEQIERDVNRLRRDLLWFVDRDWRRTDRPEADHRETV